ELERTTRALQRSPDERALRLQFHGLTLRFTELLTAHMDKEERVLFSLVRRLAAGNGHDLLHSGRAPQRETSWVRRLERRAAGAWAGRALSLHGLGPPKEFERLCRQFLVPAPTPARTRAWRARRAAPRVSAARVRK